MNQNEEEESVNDVELQILLEDYIKVHNNLAAVLIKTEAYDAVLENIKHFEVSTTKRETAI